MMALLTGTNGGRYIHILQTNQYCTSRVFSDHEREIALVEGSRNLSVIPEVYPFLRQEGERLRLDEVDFHDGDFAFDSTIEQVYSDVCCHYNQSGNEALGSFITGKLGRSN